MRAIVNYSTPEYYKGQQRLYESFSGQCDFSAIMLKERDLQAPKQSENPYAFKIHSIEYAASLDYNPILWLDASVYAIKDVQPVFDWLTDKGIFMEEAGHMVGNWCNDFTLNYFGITREEAMQMPMFAAGYVGFDFTNPISVTFFSRWKKAMLDGCFKGTWKDHRHDMTAGSIIANQMGLTNLFSPGGQFFAYIGEAYGQPKETAVFNLQGL